MSGHFAGYLVESRHRIDECLKLCDSLRAGVTLERGWYEFTFLADRALVDQQTERVGVSGQYEYRVLARVGRDCFKAVVCATAEEVVPEVLRTAGLGDAIIPRVDVAALTKDLTLSPGAYVLSTVFARVDAFGNSLRTVAFYGNDLADARLFREAIREVSPFRVTLRDIRRGEDALTIGGRGEVSLHYRPRALVSFDRAMKQVSRYVRWSRPEE